MKLILASNSYTRKNIFDMIGWKYDVIVSEEEERSEHTDPHKYVIDLSNTKARSVKSKVIEDAIIVSADSIIYMENKKFEKPKSKEEAVNNILQMSEKTNQAITGVTIIDTYQNKEISFTVTTNVKFKKVDIEEAKWYVENDKYILDRAGYSIAGKTSIFIDKIEGDYYNILGMPISMLYSKLKELGYTINDFKMK